MRQYRNSFDEPRFKNYLQQWRQLPKL